MQLLSEIQAISGGSKSILYISNSCAGSLRLSCEEKARKNSHLHGTNYLPCGAGGWETIKT